MRDLFVPTEAAIIFNYNEVMEAKTIYGDTMGGRVHMARKNKGLTLQDVATKVDIGIGQLSGLENNKVGPSVTLLIALADLYEVSLGWLAARPGEPMTPNAAPEQDTLGVSPEADEAAHIIDNLPQFARLWAIDAVREVAEEAQETVIEMEKTRAQLASLIQFSESVTDKSTVDKLIAILTDSLTRNRFTARQARSYTTASGFDSGKYSASGDGLKSRSNNAGKL